MCSLSSPRIVSGTIQKAYFAFLSMILLIKLRCLTIKGVDVEVEDIMRMHVVVD